MQWEVTKKVSEAENTQPYQVKKFLEYKRHHVNLQEGSRQVRGVGISCGLSLLSPRCPNSEQEIEQEKSILVGRSATNRSVSALEEQRLALFGAALVRECARPT